MSLFAVSLFLNSSVKNSGWTDKSLHTTSRNQNKNTEAESGTDQFARGYQARAMLNHETRKGHGVRIMKRIILRGRQTDTKRHPETSRHSGDVRDPQQTFRRHPETPKSHPRRQSGRSKPIQKQFQTNPFLFLLHYTA